MKKLLLLCLINLLVIGCKKEDSPANINSPITNVTGPSWQLFYMKKNTDNYIHPNPINWLLMLNEDRTFTFNLHDSISSGTYSWVQLDSINARVHFTIQTWKASVADTQYTNRLKDVLQTVDSCHYLKRPYLLTFPSAPLTPRLMELGFYGSAGDFYVYY